MVSDAVFERACQIAREAWPEIGLDEARFRAYVNERVPDGEPEPRWADLWLACGCLDGSDAAVAALERWGFPAVDGALAKLRLPDHDRHEIKQQLRTRLLVAEGDRRPRLADYSGRGDLRGYLRIAATRLALNVLRDASRREIPNSDRLPDVIVDPELQQLQARYRGACEAALGEAIDQLSPRERTLLRQQLIDGVTIQQLAMQHRVHRATVARWLDDARASVIEHVKRALRERHGVGDDDLASVLRVVRSQLDVSLPRRLR